MILKQVHLDFWRSKQSRPAWVERLACPKIGVFVVEPNLIDQCINAHAGLKWSENDLDVHNLLTLCRGYQRRGELWVNLMLVAHNPGTVIRPEHRSVIAKRWLRKLAPKPMHEWPSSCRDAFRRLGGGRSQERRGAELRPPRRGTGCPVKS